MTSGQTSAGAVQRPADEDPRPCTAPHCIDGTVFTHEPSWDDPGYEHGTPCPTCKGSGWVDGDEWLSEPSEG
jgi:hypothetical protein